MIDGGGPKPPTGCIVKATPFLGKRPLRSSGRPALVEWMYGPSRRSLQPRRGKLASATSANEGTLSRWKKLGYLTDQPAGSTYRTRCTRTPGCVRATAGIRFWELPHPAPSKPIRAKATAPARPARFHQALPRPSRPIVTSSVNTRSHECWLQRGSGVGVLGGSIVEEYSGCSDRLDHDIGDRRLRRDNVHALCPRPIAQVPRSQEIPPGR